MKNAKAIFVASMIPALCAVVALTIIFSHGQEPNQTTAVDKQAIYTEQSKTVFSARNKEIPARPSTDEQAKGLGSMVPPNVETAASSEPTSSVLMAKSQPIQETPESKSQNKSRKPKRELQDPMAREILKLVGSDANAEAYWIRAIFDTSLPDEERDDLIEDLNEDGLSDPKHPGPQDQNLIMRRLVIIEEIMPYADSVMIPHLQEAYKDLKNLLAITQGGGEPVR